VGCSRITAAVCLSLLAAGCGFGAEPGVSEAERQTGEEYHPQILAELGGSYQGDEAAYLAATGAKIVSAAGVEGQCTFTLVNSDVVNAFAVPGCYIYVTRGLMSIVNSEAELASVLAHELGHVVADHSDRQQRRSIFRSIGVVAVSVLSGSESIARLASAAAGYFTLRYSRKHEYEADDLGLEYLRAAGYDPYAAVDMLAALGRHTDFLTKSRGRDEAKGVPEWAMTHPLTENRMQRTRGMAADTGVKPDTLPEHETRYLQAVDGLLYGDDPEQGFIIGRRFAHPVMRISFDAPQGFSLTNSPQAVLIHGPDGASGEFSGGKLPPQGLSAYARSVLEAMLGDARAEFGAEQGRVTNGLPTVMLPATVRTQEGTVAVTLAAYDAGGGDAYHFVMLSPASVAAQAPTQALLQSFRRLTSAEAANLRPRRIQVGTVGAADTVQSLAGRMAAEHPLDHFLMLNARDPARRLRPGERVKLVVEAR
jgi:predicted Zn-dependent protease